MKTLRDLIDSLPRGLDTPVLGELPLTADGCVVGMCDELWRLGTITVGDTDMPGAVEWYGPWLKTSDCGWVWTNLDGDYPPSECYSTKESAERAAKERQ